MDHYMFFDSHGGLWITCRCDEPTAETFGPGGCARPAPDEQAGLSVHGEAAYTRALRMGQIVTDEQGWALFISEIAAELLRDAESMPFGEDVQEEPAGANWPWHYIVGGGRPADRRALLVFAESRGWLRG